MGCRPPPTSTIERRLKTKPTFCHSMSCVSSGPRCRTWHRPSPRESDRRGPLRGAGHQGGRSLRSRTCFDPVTPPIGRFLAYRDSLIAFRMASSTSCRSAAVSPMTVSQRNPHIGRPVFALQHQSLQAPLLAEGVVRRVLVEGHAPLPCHMPACTASMIAAMRRVKFARYFDRVSGSFSITSEQRSIAPLGASDVQTPATKAGFGYPGPVIGSATTTREAASSQADAGIDVVHALTLASATRW